mgnify:CR=1 FL=1
MQSISHYHKISAKYQSLSQNKCKVSFVEKSAKYQQLLKEVIIIYIFLVNSLSLFCTGRFAAQDEELKRLRNFLAKKAEESGNADKTMW